MSNGAESASGVLTVRELVEHSGLGLTAVTGDVGLGRVIKGVHFSDADDPVPYLTSESVLISTGRTWYDDPAMGLWILDRLASIDTAALIVALGHFLDEVPQEVVERARQLKLPILTLPPGALTRSVLSYVYNVLASADLHRLRRTVAHAERPARPADRRGRPRRAAGQGGEPHRHADAAARRRRRRHHQLGGAGPSPRARWRSGRPGPSSRTRRRSASSRWARLGTSAARSCCTASSRCSSSRPRRRPRAPSSSTRRCRSSSA